MFCFRVTPNANLNLKQKVYYFVTKHICAQVSATCPLGPEEQTDHVSYHGHIRVLQNTTPKNINFLLQIRSN